MRLVWIVVGFALVFIALKVGASPALAFMIGAGFALANIALDRIK